MPAAITNSFYHRCLRWPATAAAVMFLFLGAGQQSRAQTFTVIHNFTGPDGASPYYMGLVLDASGNLYGTTVSGGAANLGTVFKIDAAGNESVLHSFTGGADGAWPWAGLVLDASGNLYGTTTGGGGSSACYWGCGIVFKIDAAGNESVVHSFHGADGAEPKAGLVLDPSGNLYGTTDTGGAANLGTVFKINASGNETVLHSFTGGNDGAYIETNGLVRDASGNLYGMTYGGGSGGGAGIVFKIDTAGNETVLHTFTGGGNTPGTDGANPWGGMVRDSSGNLYGTTQYGGSAGVGAVFMIDSAGNERLLHSFTDWTDGWYPTSGLALDTAGNLYGTGGISYEDGIVFKIDASGNETVLHQFNGTTDGAILWCTLIVDAAGNLYGTTSYGGSADAGTVFKIALFIPFSSFNAKVDVAAGGFQLRASFTQGTGSQALAPQLTSAGAINPVTQGMTLTVGTYTVTIPPGAFLQTKKGWFVYEGMIDGVALQVRLSKIGANSYELQAEGSGPSFTSLTKPLTVALALGNNSGTTVVNQ